MLAIFKGNIDMENVVSQEKSIFRFLMGPWTFI